MEVGVLLQGPNSEIILCNPKSLELLGLSKTRLLGKTSFDNDWNVINEDGSDFDSNSHPVPQAIATKKPVNNIVMGVYRPKTKDRIWLLVDAEPELTEDGNIVNVVCTFINITERKLAEEETKKSKITYSGILNSISEFVFILDENACFIDVNDSAQNFYGYTKEEFIGKTPAFLAAQDMNNMDLVVDAISKAWSGVKQNFEFWAITKTGEIFPKEVNLSIGTYFGKQVIIAVGRDILKTKLMKITSPIPIQF
jgi:PAS domain S-box-containing protein